MNDAMKSITASMEASKKSEARNHAFMSAVILIVMLSLLVVGLFEGVHSVTGLVFIALVVFLLALVFLRDAVIYHANTLTRSYAAMSAARMLHEEHLHAESRAKTG